MPTPAIPGSSTTSLWVTSDPIFAFCLVLRYLAVETGFCRHTRIPWISKYCGGVANNSCIVPWQHKKDSCVAQSCVAWSDNSRWQFEFPSNSLRTRTFGMTFGNLLRDLHCTRTFRMTFRRSAVYSLTLYCVMDNGTIGVTDFGCECHTLFTRSIFTDFGAMCHWLWMWVSPTLEQYNIMCHWHCTSVMDNGTIDVTDFGCECHRLWSNTGVTDFSILWQWN